MIDSKEQGRGRGGFLGVLLLRRRLPVGGIQLVLDLLLLLLHLLQFLQQLLGSLRAGELRVVSAIVGRRLWLRRLLLVEHLGSTGYVWPVAELRRHRRRRSGLRFRLAVVFFLLRFFRLLPCILCCVHS